ncbi:hypothetical protein RDV64_03405 [Acuticoccus sp. MNP-M23]|uniref:hypothetical protein n=1 Tax=Acuticoccus sp. MNP-M23 TaxID=3072793 RepID=UPI0028157F7B|nr:hypothetical protein [Acuticoccus sp. MNP-M23]WMS43461.1 hypothetical protein RDV64_03405 [Acuticoccus sp. MNP-M23]
MNIRTIILPAFTAIAVGTAAMVSLPAIAEAKNRIVTCNDGTVFNFGPDDAIGSQVACAGHGGVRPVFHAKRTAAPKANTRGVRQAGTRASASGFGDKNKAVAWTKGCYAEFGPSATHPDAALLEKCLGT